MRNRIALAFVALSVFASAAFAAQVAVVNGASFRAGQPLSAGAIASAFGTFAGVTATNATAVPLPKTLAGVRVLVDDVESPLFYVSATQINFIVPFATGPGSHTIKVVAASGTQSGSFVAVSAAPGIFAISNSGTPSRAAAINQNYSSNAEDSTEARGRVVTLFATGPGALSKTIGDGEIAPTNPLITTVSQPVVYVAGVEAKVEYSGLAPNFAGLWQLNVRIPEKSFIAGRVPVQVFMDGIDSNEVSIFVAQ